MNQNSKPIQFRKWIDRFLVIDFFLVLFGAIWFLIAIVSGAKGLLGPMKLFQMIWTPVLIPAITILISGALINALWNWLLRQVPESVQDNET